MRIGADPLEEGNKTHAPNKRPKENSHICASCDESVGAIARHFALEKCSQRAKNAHSVWFSVDLLAKMQPGMTNSASPRAALWK